MDIRIVETENGKWLVLEGRVGYGPCWAYTSKAAAASKAMELIMDLPEEFQDD